MKHLQLILTKLLIIWLSLFLFMQCAKESSSPTDSPEPVTEYVKLTDEYVEEDRWYNTIESFLILGSEYDNEKPIQIMSVSFQFERESFDTQNNYSFQFGSLSGGDI